MLVVNSDPQQQAPINGCGLGVVDYDDDEGNDELLFRCEMRWVRGSPCVEKGKLEFEHRPSDEAGGERWKQLIDFSSSTTANSVFSIMQNLGLILHKMYMATVAALEGESWFGGVMGRAEAERQLQLPDRQVGDFLLRCSESRPYLFALSVVFPDGKINVSSGLSHTRSRNRRRRSHATRVCASRNRL